MWEALLEVSETPKVEDVIGNFERISILLQMYLEKKEKKKQPTPKSC